MKLTHSETISDTEEITEQEYLDTYASLMEDMQDLQELMTTVQQAEEVYDNRKLLYETVSEYNDIAAVIHMSNHNGELENILPSHISVENIEDTSVAVEFLNNSLGSVVGEIWEKIREFFSWIGDLIKKIGQKLNKLLKKIGLRQEKIEKNARKAQDARDQAVEKITQQKVEEEKKQSGPSEERKERTGDPIEEIRRKARQHAEEYVNKELQEKLKSYEVEIPDIITSEGHRLTEEFQVVNQEMKNLNHELYDFWEMNREDLNDVVNKIQYIDDWFVEDEGGQEEQFRTQLANLRTKIQSELDPDQGGRNLQRITKLETGEKTETTLSEMGMENMEHVHSFVGEAKKITDLARKLEATFNKFIHPHSEIFHNAAEKIKDADTEDTATLNTETGKAILQMHSTYGRVVKLFNYLIRINFTFLEAFDGITSQTANMIVNMVTRIQNEKEQ